MSNPVLSSQQITLTPERLFQSFANLFDLLFRQFINLSVFTDVHILNGFSSQMLKRDPSNCLQKSLMLISVNFFAYAIEIFSTCSPNSGLYYLLIRKN